MRSICIFPVSKQVKLFWLILLIIIAGCSLEKKNGFNRALQNLTAHYNLLFNANEILKQKQADYALGFTDTYDGLLSVYQDTTVRVNLPDKTLEAVIVKAHTIIDEKEQSKYIGDAYLVLGKANFLSARYYDAAEFFGYVMRSFPKRVSLTQEAAVWEVRSLLYVNNLHDAKLVIDTAFKKIDPKKNITADIYAAKLLYAIKTQKYTEAEFMAEKAVAFCKNKNQKLRWTFILAQLQELNHRNIEAIVNYTHIIKSNASFEMAFNADLNRIRIDDMRNGVKLNRISGLLALLKEPNNNDFKDQIYYQIGEIYFNDNDINNAIKYYNLALANGFKNQNQRGLAYLRIADIDFKNKADYVNAKKYYDSTLTALSPTYPEYQLIRNKSNNLQLLVDRLNIIAREDTLQMLAGLDEKTRLTRIDAMVAAQVRQQNNAVNTLAAVNNIATPQNTSGSLPLANIFYFNNVTIISQGFNDFKRRWGNRKLEDNWRISNKAGGTTIANAVVQTSATNGPKDVLPANTGTSQTGTNIYRNEILKDLPLTPSLLQQSNNRIYNAYLDIANFYRDILGDKKEAIASYLLLLNKFPDNPNKPLVYYNLYRLYSENNAALSDDYKNRLLKEYPQTIYAKVIIDPDYSKKLDDSDAQLNTAYNGVYELYAQKKYPQVIAAVDDVLKQYPNNRLLVQLNYLRTIANGHQEKVEPFRAELEQIASTYPDDRLITPLVKQHLVYVETNAPELASQPFALMDNDATRVQFVPPIVYQKETVYNRNRQINANIETIAQPARPAVQTPAKTEIATAPVKTPTTPAAVAPVKAAPSIFANRDSTNYYFVINVSTGTTDLSSSRFGIGQFNRANFQANTIKHELKNAGADNQLIYVGRFYSMGAAKDYAKAIIPLMPQIMKVSKDKYSFFIITKENLDKLADKKLLDSYIDYYQKTY